jgi:hypothetical protein
VKGVWADLAADEVDRWLTAESGQLSTDTVAKLLSILRQSIRRAQARDLVQRNVALLCRRQKAPAGGRRSRSLLSRRVDFWRPRRVRPCTHTSWSRCLQVHVRRN